VIGLCLAWAAWLDSLLSLSAATPLGVKIVISLLLIAPLAFAMGQLFPCALAALAREQPALVPWAWAVNGCASVIGAVLAMVLALGFGFDGCLLAATTMYAVTLVSFPA
jgi:hypothetical protein